MHKFIFGIIDLIFGIKMYMYVQVYLQGTQLCSNDGSGVTYDHAWRQQDLHGFSKFKYHIYIII